jgi:uncharacterized membrane-anchored protein
MTVNSTPFEHLFGAAAQSLAEESMPHRHHLPQHPQRVALHNEIHARPPEPMVAPVALTHILMLTDAAQRELSREHLAKLLRDHHLPPPAEQLTHLRADLGAFRLRWEMHTEFVTYTFIRPLELASVALLDPSMALDMVPQEWLAGLPGACLSSLHLWALPQRIDGAAALRQRLLFEDTAVASRVVDGAAEVHTDFAIHADGYSRVLVLCGALTPRRLGRLMQRLIEIEGYRMAALLGLPIAREAMGLLTRGEGELASLAGAIRTAQRNQEPELLDRLTRLAGEVEGQYASTHSRFSASRAYFDLVNRRINDIAETRLEGMQTIRDFMERRLSPAMSTCDWAERRQQALSERISRMSSLLRTRVEIEQQQSSQALLASMNQRQDLQLKLQSTVEGLSVAAITYYIVGLVSYLAKGAHLIGWPLAAETTAAVAIPFVAFGVWWSIRRMHRQLTGH